MHSRAYFGFWVCILAIWMQIFAPAASMVTSQSVDPLAVVCSHSIDNVDAPSGHDDRQQTHQDCPLCQHHVGEFVYDDRPRFTTFDYPVAGPVRWVVAKVSIAVRLEAETAQPRGPPQLV